MGPSARAPGAAGHGELALSCARGHTRVVGERALIDERVVLAGPKVAGPARALLDAASAEVPAKRGAMVWSASLLRDGEAVLVRAAAEEMLARLRAALSFVPELLGDDPFARWP